MCVTIRYSDMICNEFALYINPSNEDIFVIVKQMRVHFCVCLLYTI